MGGTSVLGLSAGHSALGPLGEFLIMRAASRCHNIAMSTDGRPPIPAGLPSILSCHPALSQPSLSTHLDRSISISVGTLPIPTDPLRYMIGSATINPPFINNSVGLAITYQCWSDEVERSPGSTRAQSDALLLLRRINRFCADHLSLGSSTFTVFFTFSSSWQTSSLAKSSLTAPLLLAASTIVFN
ncbi:hypothetical protein Q1695_006885 [Nippostrongylus brasiliensis]|nr:hypothetical protein Q1695_006885 [Nippostrongylus brasiliensis]